MRILNRPMFKYGGPIREGIMHGMRNGGRAALVGNPVYPKTDGREHHKLSMMNPMNWKNIFTGANIAKNPTVGSKVVQGIKNIFGSTSPVTHTPIKKVPTMTGELWKTPFKQGEKFVRSGKDVTKNIWNPNYLGRTSEFQLGKKLWEGKGLIGKPIKAGAQFLYRTPTASIPLVYFGGKWLLSDGTPAPDQDKINNQIAGGGEGWDPGAGGKQIITDSMRDKLAKDAQNKRLQSYLDIMGYDRSKKNAMSDALIDASALVQDATTEAGSLKKADWGKLINKAIQTTSKRMDKPEQIREAIGLMMTKGEIEKDIAEGKGSQYDVKEKYLTGKLGQVAGQRAALQKPTSLSEAVLSTKATDSKKDRTSQALRTYYDGFLTPTFKGKISQKKIDALGGDDVLAEGMNIGLDNGVYQISKSYIVVEGNKIIKFDDVFTSED